jgi:hypothetical protein
MKGEFKKNLKFNKIANEIESMATLGGRNNTCSVSPSKSHRNKLEDLKRDLFVQMYATNKNNDLTNLSNSGLLTKTTISSQDITGIKSDTSGLFKRKISDLLKETLSKKNEYKEESRFQR